MVVDAEGSGYTSLPTIGFTLGAVTYKREIHNAADIAFPKPIKFGIDQVVTITLATGGSGVVGYLAYTAYEA